MILRDIDHANQELQKLYVLAKRRLGDDTALDRMGPLLQAAGNPHQSTRVIHIAGTSGKTSTAYYTAALLQSTGAKVGLTVSPHVDSVTERIQIDGTPISEQEFCDELGEFMDIVAMLDGVPSYFELMIAFVYWVFYRKQVDYAVVETGLGGLFDATNVTTRRDKVCVITDIGIDHVNVLGDDIAGIAKHKAGIIQEHNITFMYAQSNAVMAAVAARVRDKKATLTLVDDTPDSHEQDSATIPLFQKRNWALAMQVCHAVAVRDSLQLPREGLRPSDVIVPGRMETTTLKDDSLLILDGSHNRQKVASFVESFIALYPNEQADILVALKEGKEYAEVMQSLKPITQSLIVTTFDGSQDFPVRSQDPAVIVHEAHQLDIKAEAMHDNAEAYRQLLQKNTSRIKLVIGSFYLLGQIRSYQ